MLVLVEGDIGIGDGGGMSKVGRRPEWREGFPLGPGPCPCAGTGPCPGCTMLSRISEGLWIERKVVVT